MDITLLLVEIITKLQYNLSFNPCFNGYYTSTGLWIGDSRIHDCSFNPCFNGYYTSTGYTHSETVNYKQFQSLF